MEEVTYQAGFKDLERTGGRGKFHYSKYAEPIDTFEQRLCLILQELGGKIKVDPEYLVEIARTLPYIQFINPLAYILGEHVVRNDLSIDCKEVVVATAIASQPREEIQKLKVTKTDIIRYARMWQELKK